MAATAAATAVVAAVAIDSGVALGLRGARPSPEGVSDKSTNVLCGSCGGQACPKYDSSTQIRTYYVVCSRGRMIEYFRLSCNEYG